MRYRDLNRLWEQLISRHPETVNWSDMKLREEFNRLKKSIEEGRGKVLLTRRQVRPISYTAAAQEEMTVKRTTTAPQNINPNVESLPTDLILEACDPSTSYRTAQTQQQLKPSSDNSSDDVPLVAIKSKRQQQDPVNLVTKKKCIGKRDSGTPTPLVKKRRNRRAANNNQSVTPLKKFRFTLEYDPIKKIVLLPERTDDKLLKAHTNDMHPIDLTKKVSNVQNNEDNSYNENIYAIDLTLDNSKSSQTLWDENQVQNILCDDDHLSLIIQPDINMPSLENEYISQAINNGSIIELDKKLSDHLNFSNFQFENVYINDASNELNEDTELPSRELNVFEEIENSVQPDECLSKHVTKNVGEPVLGLSCFEQQSHMAGTEDASVETIMAFDKNMEINIHSEEQPEKENLIQTVQTIQFSFIKGDESKEDSNCSGHRIGSIEDNGLTVSELSVEEHQKNVDVNTNEDELTFDALIAGGGMELPFSEVSTLACPNSESSHSSSDESSTSDSNSIQKSDSSNDSVKSCNNSEDSLFLPSIFERSEGDSHNSINTKQPIIEKPKETETSSSEKTNQDTTNNDDDFSALNFDEVLDYEPDEENNDVLSVATSWNGSDELTTPVKPLVENGISLKEASPQPTQELVASTSIDATLNPKSNQFENIECRPFRIPKLKRTEENSNAENAQKSQLLDNKSNPFSSTTNVLTLGRNRFTRNSLEKNSATSTRTVGAGVLPTRLPLRRNLMACSDQPIPFFSQATLNHNQPMNRISSHTQPLFGIGQRGVVYPHPNSTMTSSLHFSCIPKPSINDTCVQLFGIVCYSHLDGRCNGLQCGQSHDLHNIGEVQNKLIRLNETELKYAYVFAIRNKLLFKKFFPSFAIVLSNRRKMDLLVKMVADCSRYPDCSSPFLKILYDALLQCGFNQVAVCKLIMDRCLNPVMKRWPNQLTALVSIVMSAGWANNLHYIAEICECKEFKFPEEAMSTILDDVLHQNDPNLTNHVASIVMRISLEHIAAHVDKIKLLMMKLQVDFNTNASAQHEELNPDYMSLF